MTSKAPNQSATNSTAKPKITLAANVSSSASDLTIDDTRNDLLDDGYDIHDVDLIALYKMGDDIADEIFQGITDPKDCKDIACPHLGTIGKTSGFDCDVFEKKESPSLCPMTQFRMAQLRDALIIWTDDFGEGDNK